MKAGGLGGARVFSNKCGFRFLVVKGGKGEGTGLPCTSVHFATYDQFDFVEASADNGTVLSVVFDNLVFAGFDVGA